jgi:hypothetical protein
MRFTEPEDRPEMEERLASYREKKPFSACAEAVTEKAFLLEAPA